MSILKYSAFLKAVEYGSLTKAAEALVYTQPGISHMISSLEKEMGFPLLIRGKDGVFPTENAKPLIYYMQQIVSADETLKEISWGFLQRLRQVGPAHCLPFFFPSSRCQAAGF